MNKKKYERVNEPKFRPEEVAEILGVDREAVKRLTDKRLMGYYQFGPRTRRIGERHLKEYLSATKTKAWRVFRKRRAELVKRGILW